MFCPNCGTELVNLNQKFCHVCGYDLSLIFNRPELRTVKAQNAAIAKSQLTPTYASVPVIQQKIGEKREVGPYSKKCLAFSIVSCAIALFCVLLGGATFIFIIISRSALIVLIGFIIIILANTIGLIFGILSRVENTKAKRSEPSNSVKKVGSVFGIHGIIFNTIELGFLLTIIGIAIAFATL